MITQGTAETEAILACTGHRRNNSTELFLLDATFNGVFAIRRRAPLQVLFVIYIGTCEEDLVSVYPISNDTMAVDVVNTGT